MWKKKERNLFLDMYDLVLHPELWAQVEKEVEETGAFTLTAIDVTCGARLAWRNAPLCTGPIG